MPTCGAAGRYRLTARERPASTTRRTGSLSTSLPAGIVIRDAPAKATGERVSTATAAARSTRATETAPISSGASP